MAVAPPRTSSPEYRPPDFRPAWDYVPLIPSEDSKWWGLLVGAAAVFDPFVVLHETRPWLSTPWRDRAYLAFDFARVQRQVELDWPPHPVQERLFEADELSKR
jgi:hypothetical protein